MYWKEPQKKMKTVDIRMLELQLTFEQHGFELHGSTYKWIFSIVNITVLCNPQLVELTDVDKKQMQRTNHKL